MIKYLHIVTLDNPYPPDYGGAIDMFQRIVSLHAAGVKIYLHYFSYNDRTDISPLQNYCESITAYPRTMGLKGLKWNLPFIISSRESTALAANLNKDQHPLFIDGIHCAAVLKDLDLSKRKVMMRMHNDESCYYKKLSQAEISFSKKIFFKREARLLRKYEYQLPKECIYAFASAKDKKDFEERHPAYNTIFLTPFNAWKEVCAAEGIGNFCLYHGNLSVAENEKAVMWLLQKVFTKIQIPFVVAGKKPSRRIQKMAHLCQHTCLVADPSEKEMTDLIRKAHIHILPSMNNTGIKLKLVHALYEGRHCVVNDAAVEGSGLEETCYIGNNENAIASIIMQLYHQPFSEEDIRLRKKILHTNYNNEMNAKKIIASLY